MLIRRILCILPILAFSTIGLAQEVTSVILGVVNDPTDAVVPRATVTATETATGQNRSAISDEAGRFRFNDVRAGIYSIRVQADGFKAFELRNVNLLTGETRDLGKLVLQIGAVSEEVSVMAQSTPVQTASSERSASVTPEQLDQLSLKGRDPFDMLHLIPGVVDASIGTRDLENAYSMGNISINGLDPQSLNVAIDGVTEMDEGGNYTAYVTPNMDSIAEMRVLTNGYQAEYGRQSGGTINVISKGGSRTFHGSGHFDHRNEDLNANTFFNNRQGIQRPLYRYMIAGYSLGGPAYIPKHWNTGRNRLFFFISQEFTQIAQATVNAIYNEPTALERAGNFSQSKSSNGAVIPIIDPSTGSPFPGNIIPTNRVDATGSAMLNLLPLPNGYVNPAPGQQFNSNFIASATPPYNRRNTMLRFDAAITNKINMYYTYGQDVDNQYNEFTVTPAAGTTVRFLPGYIHRVHVADSISPTTVNEFTFGVGHDNYGFYHTTPDSQWFRTTGLNPPTLRPFPTGPQYENYLPCETFSGGNLPNPGYFNQSQSGGTGCSLVPYKNFNDGYVAQDDVTKIIGSHSFKAGIYYEWNSKVEPSAGSTYYGSFNFGSNTNNPADTGDGYANALLGNYQTYTEATNRAVPNVYWWNVEGYVQDSWRVSKKLTIDVGVRLVHEQALNDNAKYISNFYPQLWNAAQRPILYQQGSVAGKSAAFNPITGQYTFASLVGTIIPGSGNPVDGMSVDGLTGHGDFSTFPALVAAPRLGFAWDPQGNGKMVIRASAGLFYNRTTDSFQSGAGVAPVVYTPVLYYGTIGNIPQAAQNSVISPFTAGVLYGSQKIEHVNAFNLTVQRDIGFNTVVDVAFVGNYDRDGRGAPNPGSIQTYTIPLNPVPFRAYANPANLFNNTEINSNLLLQNYPGMGPINYYSYAYTGVNYNSLQASAQHRLSHGLTFGAAFTLSRALGIQGNDAYHAERSWYYGPVATDRKAVLTWNFSYALPAPTTNKVVKAVLGNWTLSGIGVVTTGAPITPTCSSTAPFPASDPSQTGVGSNSITGVRCQEVADPNSYSHNFFNNFNTNAFALAPIGTFGNVGIGILRRPTWWNFDTALYKKIQIKERLSLQLRAQAYNVFNHTEFNNIGSTFQWNASGVNLSTTTGQYTATQPPRQMALSARIDF